MIENLEQKYSNFNVLNENPPKIPSLEILSLDQEVEKIRSSAALNNGAIKTFLIITANYFNKGRPKFYERYEKIMTPRFGEFINRISFIDLTTTSHNYFQFTKTVRPAEQVTDVRQKQLSLEVLEPYLNRLKTIKKNDAVPELIFKKNPENVLIVTRHASTQGAYAPGKSIFVLAKSLVEKKKNVRVITAGHIDNSFKNLMAQNTNLSVISMKTENDLEAFRALRGEIKEFAPNVIFTEIELSILVALEVFKMPSPIYLISAGFYRVPWYSGVLITDVLEKMMGKTDEVHPCIKIPETHLHESLAPHCDINTVAEKKASLGISDQFVIASFARYEKFSKDFLLMTKAILERIPNSVIILAGSNDQSTAR